MLPMGGIPSKIVTVDLFVAIVGIKGIIEMSVVILTKTGAACFKIKKKNQ